MPVSYTHLVRELSEKGVRVLENKEDLKQLKAGENIPTVIIRAHGVAKEIYDIMEANGLECIDATCPFVKKIHRIVEQKSTEGYHVIVVGDPKHPEVEGIVGWCPGPVTVPVSYTHLDVYKRQIYNTWFRVIQTIIFQAVLFRNRTKNLSLNG